MVFLDKVIQPSSEIPLEEQPINQHWSWDRILRSCFIKQADVLQGLYFFEDHFDTQTIKRNFDFYEPLTVHESSLSPCIHSILASKIGDYDKAYKLYLRTARLDLDDYNNDTEDGLHITSMTGSWLSIVKGFGGMKIVEDKLSFNPFLPKQWSSYSFNIRFRDRIIAVKIEKDQTIIENKSQKTIEITVNKNNYRISANEKQYISRNIMQLN